MLLRHHGNNVTLERLHEALEEGLLYLGWHLLYVLFHNAPECLTQNPKTKLTAFLRLLVLLAINLVKEL